MATSQPATGDTTTVVSPTPTGTSIPVAVSNLNVQTTTLFGQNAVISLTESDFDLNTDHPITLIDKISCSLILFYTENQESRDLAEIWSQVAQIAPGPTYSAVNMIIYPKIAHAFSQIGTINTSLRPFELKGYPFIISYQNGWPIAFFNGERSVGTLSDWSLTLACRPGYFEPIQLAGGLQINSDFQMGGWKEYTPPRIDSLQYTISNPIRQFDKNSKVNSVSSAQRASEAPTVEAAPPSSSVESALPSPSGVISPGEGAST